MNYFLLGLIATALFSLTGNAQIKLLTEKDRLIVAKTMSTFVTDLRSSYVTNETFESFSKKVCDTKTISTDGVNLLKKAFSYIKAKSTNEYVLREENGKELIEAYNNFKSNKIDKSFDSYLLGSNETTQFKGFWKWLKEAFEWLGCCANGVYCCNGN